MSQVIIQGKVNDSANEPVEYFTLTLLNPKDSGIIKGGTFIKGLFMMSNVQTGSYILRISSIGFSTIYKEIKLDTLAQYNFDFIMNPKVEELKQVQVIAKLPKIVNKVDRYVIEVENTSISDAGNALAALNRTPFIIVDNITREISVAGRGSTMVMINNRKITNNKELEILNSQNIKQIEVIENPSAKYEAEGHSVINIITIQNKTKGLNLNVNSLYSKGRHNSGQFSGDLTYVTEKFVLFTQYGYTKDNSEGFNSSIERFIKEDYRFKSNSQNTENLFKTNMNEFALGVNFKLTPTHFISAKYEGNLGEIKGNTINELNIEKNNIAYPTEILNSKKNDTPNRSSLNFNYQYSKKGVEFSLVTDYTYSETKSDNYMDEHDVNYALQNFMKNNWLTAYNLYSVQYDLKIPLSGINSALEIGSRYSDIISKNESVFYNNISGNWTINPDYTSSIEFKEKIFGSYTMLSGKLYKKNNYSIGIRYEYSENKNFWGTDSDANSTNRLSLSNLFPSILFSHKANDSLSFRISYSRRITRPSYNSLNNSVWYVNSYSTRQGNPYLQPTLNNTVSLSSKIRELNASVSVSYIQNPVDLLYINDKAQIEKRVVKYVNTKDRWSFSLNINSSFHIKFWSLQPFFTFMYMERSIIEDGVKYTTKYPGGIINLRNQFDVTKKTFIDFDVKFRRPYHSFKKFNDQYEFNLALRQKLFKDKMTLQIAYQYIPTKWSQLMDYSYKYIDFTWDGDDRNMLTVSLRFNFNPTKKKFQSKTSSKEEVERM